MRIFRRITRAQRAEQFKGSTHLSTGFWRDRAGNVHVNLGELCAIAGLENTPENQAEVAALVRERLEEKLPAAPIIEVLVEE